jgi:hypothetical protein
MTHPSLHQDGENINSDRPRCRGVSAILRRVTVHQPFGFAQGRKRGWKGALQLIFSLVWVSYFSDVIVSPMLSWHNTTAYICATYGIQDIADGMT